MRPRTSPSPTWAGRKALQLAVLGILGTVPLVARAQTTPRVESRVYRLPRYEEDWSFLRTSTGKVDWLDPIKFVPLNDGGETYLSLGGEVRETYERLHNPNFGFQPQDPDGYQIGRAHV